MKALFLESLPYRSAFRVGSHHYADRFLAAGWDAMWLSQPISPLHFLRRTKRDFDERVNAWRAGPLQYGSLSYYSPMTLLPTAALPVLDSATVARHSALATMPSVRRVIAGAGFDTPDLIWLTNPVYQPLAARLRPSCLAVRVADDHTQFRDTPASIRELEDASVRSADVVFAVAGTVFDRLSETRDDVVLLPNGVDAKYFATVRDEPTDLAGIPHPRVIYVGALEYWFDVGLFERCVRARPDAQFVVIGPHAASHLGGLVGAPNVHVLGSRPYEAIPAYLQHCDLGIVPFARDALVDSVHPIKVYEYLAAGLRVVATPWTELESMDAPILLADTLAFVSELDRLLDEPDTPAARDERLAYARANSWDVRFAVVEREVARVIEKVRGHA